MFLSAAVYSRIQQPQILTLSKADLISEQDIDMIVSWATEPNAFDQSLQMTKEENFSLISRNLANAIFESGLLSEPIPVSAKTNSGFLELNAAVTRILSGGEEPST
jgi:hypothetical protein